MPVTLAFRTGQATYTLLTFYAKDLDVYANSWAYTDFNFT